MLKPMPISAIKADIFPSVKVKKKVAAITSKPRTALLQEGENDVNIPTFAAASESLIHCEEPIKSAIQFGSISNNFFGNNVAMTKGTLAAKKIPDINAQLNEPSKHYITIKGNASVIIHCLDESCDANKSLIQFGSLSNFVGHHSKKDEEAC